MNDKPSLLEGIIVLERREEVTDISGAERKSSMSHPSLYIEDDQNSHCEDSERRHVPDVRKYEDDSREKRYVRECAQQKKRRKQSAHIPLLKI